MCPSLIKRRRHESEISDRTFFWYSLRRQRSTNLGKEPVVTRKNQYSDPLDEMSVGIVADDAPAERPSKTLQKRVHADLLTLAEELTDLPKGRLSKVELPDSLKEAVDLARRLPHGGARKRQLSYVRRLLEGSDHQSIRSAIFVTRGRPSTK